MKTEQLLAAALRKQMGTTPIDEITVKHLSEVCSINRQTFYYHFRDIYDLLTWVFLNEQIKGFHEASNWNDALEAVFTYLFDQRKFIMSTMASAGRDLVTEFLHSNFYSFHLSQLAILEIEHPISSLDRRHLVSFFSSGIVAILTDWIITDMKESPIDIIDRIEKYQGDYLSIAMARR
jgi:AcrR family transcriptional regulator